MGVMLGEKENFFEELSSLGFTSFLFFLLPTGFSIILVYYLTKVFMKKVVKRTLMAFIVMCVSLSALAQDVTGTRVTVDMKGVYVRTALAQIRVMTGVFFGFRDCLRLFGR